MSEPGLKEGAASSFSRKNTEIQNKNKKKYIDETSRAGETAPHRVTRKLDSLVFLSAQPPWLINSIIRLGPRWLLELQPSWPYSKEKGKEENWLPGLISPSLKNFLWRNFSLSPMSSTYISSAADICIPRKCRVFCLFVCFIFCLFVSGWPHCCSQQHRGLLVKKKGEEMLVDN